MHTPQQGIFQENSSKFYHLEYKLNFSHPLARLLKAISTVISEGRDNVHLVIAFGPKAWRSLQPNWVPEELEDFKTIDGINGFTLPSTQRDVFFWVHSKNHDDNLDTVLKIQQIMGEVASLELDLTGFAYHDSRDLTGFIDGSANPKGDDRHQVAIIPDNLIGAGGSYVLTQQWKHQLREFSSLPLDQQEKVIGRTKSDSIELAKNKMPENSHVSRTDVEIDGKAMKIYRRSSPYGSATEQGLYFLSFSCEINRFNIQLERMFGTTSDGIHDKLIEFSQPTTSSYWFAPSSEDLLELVS
ncbi:MAG: putative iron-dependent peroxidase [Gammaproteobacteria bacterium]|jgi:putative iron-dependent peroxidase